MIRKIILLFFSKNNFFLSVITYFYNKAVKSDSDSFREGQTNSLEIFMSDGKFDSKGELVGTESFRLFFKLLWF